MSQLLIFLAIALFIAFLMRKKRRKTNITVYPKPVSKSFSKQPIKKTRYKNPAKRNVRKKSENPQWGRVASTTNSYILKNDGTAIDIVVSNIRSELKIDETVKTKVSGLSSKPRRERGHWHENQSSSNLHSKKSGVAKKLYKVGFEFLPKKLLISEDQFRYDPDKGDYVGTVLEPLHEHLRTYFYQFQTVEKYVSKITGRFRSSGKVSVWMNVWCEIDVKEAFHHLIRFRTPIMVVNPSVTISLLDQILENSKFSISEMYDDYGVQSKIFSILNEKLYDALGIDPVKWKNQELLAKLISSKFERVKTEYIPKWLGQQRIDIYIPSLKLAIEYQGIQHYEPVSVFGGEEGFKKTVMRDKKKLEAANKNGVRLLYWHYSNDVSEQNLEQFLLEHNVNFRQ